MKSKNNLKQIFMSVLVVFWIGIFHYESIRHFYLQPHFEQRMFKMPFLFPPAGWIMFFKVDKSFAKRDIFAKKENQVLYIDPHQIFPVPTIGFDNIKRGILGSAASPRNAKQFCQYLFRNIPDADEFLIQLTYHQDVTINQLPQQKVEYICQP